MRELWCNTTLVVILKVAPEHTDPNVLDKMRKPATDDFEKFY